MMNSIIKCPWCKTYYSNATETNCKNCGGTLEYTKNSNLAGVKPQDAPRILPSKYVRRMKYTGNVTTIIGIVFTIVFCWTIIFPIIGVFLWWRGAKTANEELKPLQYGKPVLGEIESISIDHTKHINGVSPFIVQFLFEINGQKFAGSVGNIFDRVDLTKKKGDSVWVVYMPEDPSLSSIWPPLT